MLFNLFWLPRLIGAVYSTFGLIVSPQKNPSTRIFIINISSLDFGVLFTCTI